MSSESSKKYNWNTTSLIFNKLKYILMNPKHLKIDYFKSSGPGGQHKNKRFTAVRITHVPTGIVAVAQENRSQARNKEVALKRLAYKLEIKKRRLKPRIPVRMPKAVKEKILQWKKKRGLKKKLRSKKIDMEE